MYYNAGVVGVNYGSNDLASGANPTILSYNASVVKIYNATNSIARLKKIPTLKSHSPTTLLAL
jgi:hypothetical protein